jgi:uncharacterized membrane protein YdjX (TVP38/TMEM64 family)
VDSQLITPTVLDSLTSTQRTRIKSILTTTAFALLLLLFMQSGLREFVSAGNLRALGQNPWTPVLIVVAMAGAWTFALPASVFFFIAPLLFAPPVATAVVCAGCAAGTTMGYLAARYVGGPWVERFRDHRVTRFVRTHSSFASLFAIRVFPSSPHGFINYGAGLAQVPFVRFLLATLAGVGIKAYLYAVAIAGSVGASTIGEALNWQTVSALTVLAALALVGHLLHRRWRMEEGRV